MGRIAGFGVMLGLLVLLAPLAAGQEVSVYTIPSNISVNSSFLWVASVPGAGEDTRVSWAIIGRVDYGGLGSLGKLSGSKWFCDFERTCGPNPFPMAGVYEANIYVTSESGTEVNVQSITVSDLKPDPHLYITGNDVLVQVYVPGSSASLTYSLYDANTLNVFQVDGQDVYKRNLAYCNCLAGFYNTSMNLENGKYYLSFDASTDGKSGGSLHYFTIGEELKPLSVSLDKEKYWLGEKVRISGTTTHYKVGGEISRSGVFKENITLDLDSRGEYSEFSYDYRPKETGSYELIATAGEGNDTASQTVSFIVSELMSVTIPDIQVNESGALDRNFIVRNQANQTLNITVSPDSNLEGYVTPSLEKASLGPGESTTLTLSIRNIISSIQGEITFQTSLADVKKTVRIIMKGASVEKPQLGVNPTIWSPDEGYLIGMVSKTFTITNDGTGTLEDLQHFLSSDIEGMAVVEFNSTSVEMFPDEAEIEVSLDPIYSGRYKGTLSITSNGGSQDILIDLEFFDDINVDADIMEAEIGAFFIELTGKGLDSPSVLTEISSDLELISGYLDDGDYATANREFERVKGKWSGVKSMMAILPEPGMDLSLVLIVVVIVVAGAGAFFLIKKLRSGGGGEKKEKEESEEDLEEELY